MALSKDLARRTLAMKAEPLSKDFKITSSKYCSAMQQHAKPREPGNKGRTRQSANPAASAFPQEFHGRSKRRERQT